MKALKIIGIIVGVLLLVLVIIGLTGAKTYDVHRETVINAPAEVVFANVSHFEQFPKWSPWQHLDTAMKTNIEGTDGTVGAKYSWEGKGQAGSGSMTITKLESPKFLEQDLHFVKPFESHATTYMSVAPTEGGSKITWGMKGESGFVSRIFMTLMGGMDKAIGKDFETGLAQLKTLSESGATATASTTYEVKEVDWAEKNCLSTKRQTVKFQDMANLFGTNFPAMAKAIGEAGDKPGIPLGIYYKYDEAAMNAEMSAAIPYEGKKVSAKGFENLTIPAGKAYLIEYHGAYEKMKPAYDAMDAKLKELGTDHPNMVVEEYVTDPMNETDTTKWNTNIYFFVDKKMALK